MPVLHKFDSGVSTVQKIPFGFALINTFELLQAVERRLPLVGRCHQMIGPFWSKKNGVTGWVHWTVESRWENDIAVICALRCFCLLGPKGQIEKHRQVHDVWRWNPISDGHYHQRLLCDQFWQGLGRLKRVKGWRPRLSPPPSLSPTKASPSRCRCLIDLFLSFLHTDILCIYNIYILLYVLPKETWQEPILISSIKPSLSSAPVNLITCSWASTGCQDGLLADASNYETVEAGTVRRLSEGNDALEANLPSWLRAFNTESQSW